MQIATLYYIHFFSYQGTILTSHLGNWFSELKTFLKCDTLKLSRIGWSLFKCSLIGYDLALMPYFCVLLLICFCQGGRSQSPSNGSTIIFIRHCNSWALTGFLSYPPAFCNSWLSCTPCNRHGYLFYIAILTMYCTYKDLLLRTLIGFFGYSALQEMWLH